MSDWRPMPNNGRWWMPRINYYGDPRAPRQCTVWFREPGNGTGQGIGIGASRGWQRRAAKLVRHLLEDGAEDVRITDPSVGRTIS